MEMLSYIVVPLTGCRAGPCDTRRPVFTVVKMRYDDKASLRMCFLQPEISSATAHTSSSNSSVLSAARSRVVKKLHNPSPGGITASSEKCQVAGRISPYVVEEAGLVHDVKWSYCNASKSRFVFVFATPDGVRLMGLTKETISIYQGFCGRDCAMVYVPTTRNFKVTASPAAEDYNDDPNKSTCMFLYSDGTFKILGTPHKAYDVCRLFREAVVRAHTSPMHSKVMETLVPLEELQA